MDTRTAVFVFRRTHRRLYLCSYGHTVRCIYVQTDTQTVVFVFRRTHGEIVRDTIVLIKRSEDRRFTRHEEIKSNLQTIAREFGLRFYEMVDTRLPSIQQGFKEFYRAVQVRHLRLFSD